MNSDLVPNIFFTTPMVTVLVAGPADKNTKAAPAETPESIKPAAIGRDAVAHTYIGTAMIITIIYDNQEYSSKISLKLEGIATVIKAPSSSPIKRGEAISPRSVIKAYFKAPIKENFFLVSVPQLEPDEQQEDSSVLGNGVMGECVDKTEVEKAEGFATAEKFICSSPLPLSLITSLPLSFCGKRLAKIPAIIEIIIEVITL